MAGKNKIGFEVKIDENLYEKLIGLTLRENCSVNNYILKLIRNNIEYSERVNGKIDVSNVKLPDGC